MSGECDLCGSWDHVESNHKGRVMALDLDKLRQELDAALMTETTESFLRWVADKTERDNALLRKELEEAQGQIEQREAALEAASETVDRLRKDLEETNEKLLATEKIQLAENLMRDLENPPAAGPWQKGKPPEGRESDCVHIVEQKYLTQISNSGWQHAKIKEAE